MWWSVPELAFGRARCFVVITGGFVLEPIVAYRTMLWFTALPRTPALLVMGSRLLIARLFMLAESATNAWWELEPSSSTEQQSEPTRLSASDPWFSKAGLSPRGQSQWVHLPR